MGKGHKTMNMVMEVQEQWIKYYFARAYPLELKNQISSFASLKQFYIFPLL